MKFSGRLDSIYEQYPRPEEGARRDKKNLTSVPHLTLFGVGNVAGNTLIGAVAPINIL